MTIHENSVLSFDAMKTSGDLSKREHAVYGVCLAAGKAGRTARQVGTALGFADLNAVKPTITRLITKGVLIESGHVIDPVTRRRVRLVAVRDDSGGLNA
jgi:hypothetical protein